MVLVHGQEAIPADRVPGGAGNTHVCVPTGISPSSPMTLSNPDHPKGPTYKLQSR
jgi:hypothetical protein